MYFVQSHDSCCCPSVDSVCTLRLGWTARLSELISECLATVTVLSRHPGIKFSLIYSPESPVIKRLTTALWPRRRRRGIASQREREREKHVFLHNIPSIRQTTHSSGLARGKLISTNMHREKARMNVCWGTEERSVLIYLYSASTPAAWCLGLGGGGGWLVNLWRPAASLSSPLST